jgi:hypothetical protein
MVDDAGTGGGAEVLVVVKVKMPELSVLLGAGAGELLAGAKLCGRAAVDGGGGAGVDVPNGGAGLLVSSCARECVEVTASSAETVVT